MAPRLEGLSKSHPEYVVVKVNIDSWDSPVVKQFGDIKGIPAFKVYTPEKALKAGGQEARQEVEKLLPTEP
jgi:hypothetical protein